MLVLSVLQWWSQRNCLESVAGVVRRNGAQGYAGNVKNQATWEEIVDKQWTGKVKKNYEAYPKKKEKGVGHEGKTQGK